MTLILTSLTKLQGKCLHYKYSSNIVLKSAYDSFSGHSAVYFHFALRRLLRIEKGTVKTYDIPIEITDFALALHQMTPQTPKELQYQGSAGKIIHEMLFGKNRATHFEKTPHPDASYRYDQYGTEYKAFDWLLEPFTGDNHMLTLLHNSRKFYEDHLCSDVPISGRHRLAWFKQTSRDHGHLSVQHLKDVWQPYILTNEDSDVKRASSIMNDLQNTGMFGQGQGYFPFNPLPFEVVVVNTKKNGGYAQPHTDGDGVGARKKKEEDVLYTPVTYMNGTTFLSKQFLTECAPCSDTLAFTLGHEMTHALANHNAERLSYNIFAEFVIQHIAKILKERGYELVENKLEVIAACVSSVLPNQLILESEADQIGLQIMAHAGYNPRKVPEYLSTMANIRNPRGFKVDHGFFNHQYKFNTVGYSEVKYNRNDKDEKIWEDMVEDTLDKYTWKQRHPSPYARAEAMRKSIGQADAIREKALQEKGVYTYYTTKAKDFSSSVFGAVNKYLGI